MFGNFMVLWHHYCLADDVCSALALFSLQYFFVWFFDIWIGYMVEMAVDSFSVLCSHCEIVHECLATWYVCNIKYPASYQIIDNRSFLEVKKHFSFLFDNFGSTVMVLISSIILEWTCVTLTTNKLQFLLVLSTFNKFSRRKKLCDSSWFYKNACVWEFLLHFNFYYWITKFSVFLLC